MSIGQKLEVEGFDLTKTFPYPLIFFLLDLSWVYLSTTAPWYPKGKDSGYCREWSKLLQVNA